MTEHDTKIVAFLCTWCSYAGADLAGTGRNQYPPNVRVIRVPCSGRINPLYIIKALLEGADGVMISGCHPGDCHYLVGNYYARRRFTVLKKLLTTAGIDPDKIHFTWVSASEGVRFAETIKEITEKVKNSVSNQCRSPMFCSQNDCDDNRQKNNFNNHELFLSQEKELIELCKKLLDDSIVNTIIGYKNNDETWFNIPYIIRTSEEADKLVWNNKCIPALSGYLHERTGKTAIVAKPCDARAVVNLIRENQLSRDDVYIIGMSCDGMFYEGMADEKGYIVPGCANCQVHVPPVYDILITGSETENVTVNKSLRSDNADDSGNSSNNSTNNECTENRQYNDFSFERFKQEIDKCILCYSCRQACYGCYCKTCFMERGEPDWQTSSPDTGAKMLYHLGRVMHLAGRCVECGSCENACASGIDVRYLIKDVTDFIKETYDYQTGMDFETDAAMLSYKPDDPEIGFLGGDKCER